MGLGSSLSVSAKIARHLRKCSQILKTSLANPARIFSGFLRASMVKHPHCKVEIHCLGLYSDWLFRLATKNAPQLLISALECDSDSSTNQ